VWIKGCNPHFHTDRGEFVFFMTKSIPPSYLQSPPRCRNLDAVHIPTIAHLNV
jgi:hypothetical protein